MKLLYYIPAIGFPDLNIKLDILNKNLNYIYNKLKINFSIIINIYSDENIILQNINKIKFLDNIFTYYKKGVLTELWLTNNHNEEIKNYDYILFVLDDVLIHDIDLTDMIKIKNLYNISLLSPKVIKSTHKFMYENNCLTLNNSVEVYFLLLNPNDFIKFSSIYTIENKWMWGVDLLFGYFNINAGVYNKYYVEHMLPSKSNKREAYKLGLIYIKKYGFNNYNDIFKKYSNVKKKIIL
jgi:hypothetical protein